MKVETLLFYTPGGGGGHFVRNLSIIIKLLSVEDKTVYWLHNSPMYRFLDSLNISNLKQIKVGLEINTRKKEINKITTKLNIDLLYVDTFYNSINNELYAILNHHSIENKIFCFRELNIHEERKFLEFLKDNNNVFPDIIIPNSPYLRQISDDIWSIIADQSIYSNQILLTPKIWNSLIQRSIDHKLFRNIYSSSNSQAIEKSKLEKIHVNIVHLGNQQELSILEKEVNILQKLLKNKFKLVIRYFSRFHEIIFPGFLATMSGNLVIGGAGYNLLNETVFAGIPIISLPFPRKLDDQYSRVIIWNKAFPNLVFFSAEVFCHNFLQNKEKTNYSLDNKILHTPNLFNGANIIAQYILSK